MIVTSASSIRYSERHSLMAVSSSVSVTLTGSPRSLRSVPSLTSLCKTDLKATSPHGAGLNLGGGGAGGEGSGGAGGRLGVGGGEGGVGGGDGGAGGGGVRGDRHG